MLHGVPQALGQIDSAVGEHLDLPSCPSSRATPAIELGDEAGAEEWLSQSRSTSGERATEPVNKNETVGS